MSRHHASRPTPAKRIYGLLDVPTLCPNCDEPECDCSDEDREMAELQACTGQDVTRKGVTRHERCAWVEKSDWMGDPSVYRGTVSWKFAECLTCGAEVQQPYPDWLDAKLPQKEYY